MNDKPTDFSNSVMTVANDPLLVIGEQLRTQDNRGTANPAFCVQVLERYGPMMLEYGNGNLMFHDHEACETYYQDKPDEDRWAELKTQYEDGDLPRNISAGGYIEVWRTVQTCFTEAGCKRYLALDGHNLRHFHGVRIYAESFNRNVEMLEIREYLLANDAVARETDEKKP